MADSINDIGQVVHKNNPVPQPNHHWGDGLEKDALAYANFRMPINSSGSSEIYAFGGYSHRDGNGNPYRRYAGSARSWDQLYPLGYLPVIEGLVTDYSMAGGLRGVASGWNYDLGATFGHNHFDYHINNTLNASLGPCLDVPCAPGADGVLGTADDPGIPNQLNFFAGRPLREEWIAAANIAKPVALGLKNPVNLAFGAAFRRERYAIRPGELASYINGGAIGAGRRRSPRRAARSRSRASRRRTPPTGIATISGSTSMRRASSRTSGWPTWPRATRITATSARG